MKTMLFSFLAMDNNIQMCIACILLFYMYSKENLLEMYIALGKQSYPFGDKCYNYIFNTIGKNN